MESETPLQSAPTPVTDDDENISDSSTPVDASNTFINGDGTPTATSIPIPSSQQPQIGKKSKKKNPNSVWTKPTSRKKPKKNNQIDSSAAAASSTPSAISQPKVLTPLPRLPAFSYDDAPHLPVLLSRVHKADKIELSDSRLSASSCKGYRTVRTTRGVISGAWYFEIKIVHLGPTGHARLGFIMEKGDLQAPVGYDRFGYGYRDVDGSKVHKGVREVYGAEGFGEGDVVGFYINLPDGDSFYEKDNEMVWYKGQRFMCSGEKDEKAKVVPGSEISFFKNGVCQGVAFKDIAGGRYYPAASMYTLPNQPNCEVKFNFGPDFHYTPQDWDTRPTPRPISEVPYHGFDVRVAEPPPIENGFH